MDKNEYNQKLEEIDRYVSQGNYSEAAKIADTIDWRRVRNVRTLCMISEIYEAENRYEESKALLLRAYRRSPVGRAILYRLVEVTIQLKQFDEAIEYYSEYVQAAPHDNNKYILKYKIYKGRGASLDEQIEILKEYLSQEYTEKWAYELAKLYQQAGRIPECLAACDDLILWFHSGKYVIKALELKRRYASLTPKQQEIYDHRFDEAMDDEDERLGQEKQIVETTEDELAETILHDTEREIAEELSGSMKPEPSPEETQAAEDEEENAPKDTSPQSAQIPEETPLDEPIEDAQAFDEQLNRYNTQELQTELVKSMREIVYGVGGHHEEEAAGEPLSEQPGSGEAQGASQQTAGINLQMPSKVQMKAAEPAQAGKLSIDDILLSMGERGDAMREMAARASAGPKTQASGVMSAMDEALMGMGVDVKGKSKEQEENKPEESAESEEKELAQNEEVKQETSAADYRRSSWKTTAPLDMEAITTAKTKRIPTDEISEIHASFGLDEEGHRIPVPETETPGESPADEEESDKDRYLSDEEEPFTEEPFTQEESFGAEEPEGFQEPPRKQPERTAADRQQAREEWNGGGPAPQSERIPRLRIKDYQRGMFAGFIGIQNMEEQIANAIIQAEQRGDDRTSRSGNILIFGGHGCGKTTIATNIAKAIAQDMGSQYVKMARIYASDFNRKDVAATIAKIAGGTLIIEEAGDLEDNVVDQLTTAMEFRTDALLVILEDEQRYIHDLLMRHPRFTMKFTSQIFIPVFTNDELVRFGQIYAADRDYVLSEDAAGTLNERISSVSEAGNLVSITNVIELVDQAIHRANKFFRKLTSGKKRYDENNCIILQEKDFR